MFQCLRAGLIFDFLRTLDPRPRIYNLVYDHLNLESLAFVTSLLALLVYLFNAHLRLLIFFPTSLTLCHAHSHVQYTSIQNTCPTLFQLIALVQCSSRLHRFVSLHCKIFES